MTISSDGLGTAARQARKLMTRTRPGEIFSFIQVGELLDYGDRSGVCMTKRAALLRVVKTLIDAGYFIEIHEGSWWQRVEREGGKP